MKHIPGIDGLRALAALSVIFFHLEVPGFAWGWTGVPLFFVISGFLITRILLSLRDRSNTFWSTYLREFYIRRSLRIFPLYYAYLAVACVLALISHYKIPNLWTFFVYLQNYPLGASSFASPWVLGHTWSLAVEEQFYLLWPLIIWWAGRRRLPWVIVMTVVLSIGARIAISQWTGNPFLQFATLPSCADGLAMGAGLSLLYGERQAPSWSGRLLTAAGLLLLAAVCLIGYEAMWTPTGWVRSPLGDWFFSIVCLFYSALLWYVLAGPRRLLAMLEWAPLRQLGKISYGLYLYHGLILILTDRFLGYHLAAPSTALRVIRAVIVLGVTIVVAQLSFSIFERKFLRLKDALAASLPRKTESA
ncbi:acyltransferase family protein [Ralstonia sp. 22086]|uniref:acyltransferase family protein n=1 Tax=Ralstonia sp. 22086 TaxID=3453870 RepID=UPI003F82699C